MWEKIFSSNNDHQRFAIDPIGDFLLLPTIQNNFLDSYSIQSKTAKMCYVTKPSQLCALVYEAIEMITNNETTTNMMSK